MKPCPRDPLSCHCRICHLWNTNASYREYWEKGKTPVDERIKRVRVKCINLGEATQDAAQCGCSGSIVYKCSKHSVCRLSVKSVDGIRTCFECDDYQPPAV